MKIQNVKGGYDFLPKEQRVRNYIVDTLRKVFEEYGYNSIETPILCYYDILSDKYDEKSDILKEIYQLSDQGERKLGLRYDLTVPFAKFIALNKNVLNMPFKRYEINKVFRDGPVKLGRDREFTQCDVDVVGLEGQFIEAELMTLYIEGFKRLGIDVFIKYNSRKFMNGILIESGLDESKISLATTIIDKMNKMSKEEFKKELLDIGIKENEYNFIIDNFSLSLADLTKKYSNSNNESLVNGLNELNSLNDYFKKLNITEDCLFDPTLARGQNYYTGNVFEVYDKQKRLTCSLGGGGRYDNIITNFINDGNLYPTVGISFGLSPIYEILKNEPMFNDKSNITIYIIPMNTEVECLSLANMLRNLGINVEIEMKRKKVGKALDYANREKIPYVIVLGEDEIKNNRFVLKDMLNGNDTEIKIGDISKVSEVINND
ncbi:MAG: histidine--tRNA ligase [Bacilli bacterium]|nr:histidine--tRNA ligase [Bacilli bacterium]